MPPRGMDRRAWLLGCAGAAGLAFDSAAAEAATVPAAGEDETRALQWPRDHGAHLQHRIEWWYLTGALWKHGTGPLDRRTPPDWGFQLTFFRARTPWAESAERAEAGRLAVPQLLFAHAALTDVRAGQLHHAERTARWNGRSLPAQPSPIEGQNRAAAGASSHDTHVWMGDWQLVRQGAGYQARWTDRAQGLALQLDLACTQALLLQGEGGWSAKSRPEPVRTAYASRYYSQVQLQAQGRVQAPHGKAPSQGEPVRGVAWLDHEWSHSLLHPEAVGWDWVGLNLDQGAALTVFRLRRADGTVWWAGGSLRLPGQPVRSFAAHEVRMTPGRLWRSRSTQGVYPVEWILETPAGRHAVRSVLDDQELDSRRSTGTVYWEGLCGVHDLLDPQEARVGWGYLEMTGYTGRLRL